MRAALRGQTAMVDMLLRHDAQVDWQDDVRTNSVNNTSDWLFVWVDKEGSGLTGYGLIPGGANCSDVGIAAWSCAGSEPFTPAPCTRGYTGRCMYCGLA